ncbi:hypothetical protein GGR54DRAFT_641366 [Hypoxylon sp. NC1633]|nr:hypothetical protein GGR54DRAFT_641366 [Hypoxylon sp. NC1633]
MKPTRILYFISLWAATISAWPDIRNLPTYLPRLDSLQKFLMSKSPIPTIISDTDHPWLSENEHWLKSYPDVTQALCDKTSPLWTGQEPGKAIPSDLFHRLNIDNNKAGISRLGWANAIDRLHELRKCPAALGDVKHLHVDIELHIGSYYGSGQEKLLPLPELPELFAEVLASMPQLETLDWGIDARATNVFREEFTRQGLILPTVRKLTLGAQSHYMVPMCPGLETLVGGSFFHHGSWNPVYRIEGKPQLELVRVSASVASTLTELTIMDTWTTETLEEVLKATPNITVFIMQGALKGARGWANDHGSSEDVLEEEGSLLKKVMSVISRFPQLEELHLPESSELDLGFDGGAWCGNAYEGPEGREYGRQVDRQRMETTEAAGSIVVDSLPHLKRFSIGSTPANITRSEDGNVQVSWPWTGREDEYVHDFWPEEEDA